MNYDIYVIYYGDNEENFCKYEKKVKYIERRKGSKFQNFFFFYNSQPDIINKYDYFFILDDDIIFKDGYQDINKMFNISSGLKLSITGPSQSRNGKISHDIVAHDKTKLLSYTNFVEVGTMLFDRSAIDVLMRNFTPELIGWGIDFLAIATNTNRCILEGSRPDNIYAVIHDVVCINPHDEEKKYGKREIMRLGQADQRAAIWKNYAKKINIPSWWNPKEFSCIYRLHCV